jgi:hypothetical protein
MPKLFPRLFAPAFLAVPLVALDMGCGPEKIEVADVPPAKTDPTVPAEQQPKDKRPAKGSSAGMGYNPGSPGGIPR